MAENKNKYNGLTIYYANTLARICSKFNLEEEKILHLIFSQIKPNEKNDTIFKLLKFDFFNKLELKSDDKYTRYAKIIEGLIKKSWMKIKDEKNNPMQGYVVSASRWNYNEPFFEVELSRIFMPFLEQLVRDYTKIELDSVLKLKSKHSLTLYKWLCSWTDAIKTLNQRYITTKELKELLGLSIDDYVCKGKFNRTDFERYTIKVAINEISEKTNLSVQFKKNKKGNKIQNYEFTWTEKDKSLTIKKHKKQLPNFDLEKNQKIKKNIISQVQVNNILNNIDNVSEVVFDQ